jgi:hypothetical protein
MLLVRQRRGPVLRVGNALDRHRVGAQVARHRAVVGDAARTLHLLEERGHRVRIESGGLQRAKAEPVRLALEVARVGELRLHRARLGSHQRPRGEVGTRATKQDGRGERGQHRHLHLLLLAEHARDVPLRDVRDFMREHRGELRFGLGGADQAGVHGDEATG